MASDKPSETDTSNQIIQWYAKLYSRRVDLVGDFAGSERFLVHGESLLLHCFSDPHIDFDPGYQLLHASYAVEKFLQALVSRCCNFHLAFFDEHQELCVPQDASPALSEKYLLARAAIIRHLKVNLPDAIPDIEVRVFPSTISDTFAEYLKTTDIYFVLCHDGASFKDIRKRMISRKDLDALQSEDRSLHERQQQHKASFRTLIYRFMQRGYSAALINGLEWQDTKVVTTVLEHPRSMNLELPSTDLKLCERVTDIVDLSHMRGFLQTIRASCDQLLTEREYLTVLVASKLASSGQDELSSALLHHTSLLADLRLSDRPIANQTVSEEVKNFILDFCREARKFVGSPAWADAFAGHPECDVADLIDGRLFASCAQHPTSQGSELYETLQKATAALIGRDLPDQSSQGSGATKDSAPSNGQNDQDSSYAVLPFTNSTFDEHLAPIQLDVSRSGGKAEQTTAAIFREVSHWHNQRSLNQKTRVVTEKDPKIAKKALRRNQFFMAEMTSYAASLTNAVGKVLDPETITLGDKSKSVAPKSLTPSQSLENRKPKQAQKKGTKNINASKQAMLADIEASSKRKDEESAKQLYQAWGVFCDGLEKQIDLPSRYNKARQYLANLNSESKRQTLGPEVRVYMLNVLLEMWIRFCKDGAKEKGLYVAALIFDTARTLCSLPSVTKTIAICLTTTVDRLKLPALQVPREQGDRKLPFKFALEETSVSDLALTLTPEEFQLLHCGPYFDRTIDSAPDSRVPFEPDAWQRRVLDEIDARRSLLVIAPTSAGKTFISFYAMKQVLESNNEDVLVYVAPTKALVNQIAAEIQARFSKNYKYSQSVWGIHTRDYRINNPTGCQILVTVPHILQIMLLAPSNAKGWSERVKWIIFDEVHCIGQAEDGLVWEQLLLMAPCPIIALSATIGNAEAFNDWLAATQKAAGQELVMVQHPHRYSDLRKFVYTPPAKRDPASYLPLPTQRSFAQLGLDEHTDFAFLHPVSSLINRTRGLPSDLTLEARDCLTLWQSLSKHQTKEYPVDKSLNPSAVLPTIIKKADIIKWQTALKDILSAWMADDASPFEIVRKYLSSSIANFSLSQRDENAEVTNDASQVDEMEMEITHDISSILPLLADLQLQDALPGIIFNYDRSICERMCQTLLKQLTEAEVSWKQSSPKWKDKLAQWEEWKKEVARREKQGLRGEASKGMTKQDQMREAANVEVSAFASFDPNKPLDGFHFADNKKLSQEELEAHVKELRYRGCDEWLIDGLRRGIGVHHAGLNRKYRYCVEMLFRRGYLRVVIATGTLALGINMPCKTVVFSGDSVFLTALNFRQAAGRAGRRGFDMLGNVVFHGVSLSKIHKLISSRLPDLNGHFPITTTLVLRLFTLLHSSENSRFAVRCVNALLSQPRLYLGGEDAKLTVLHHLRFSIEYLRRQHLLDGQGVPLNFAGVVSHLYFTENSSFAFHALLKDGYFHELCAKIDTNRELVLRELMLTMSHLFGRRHCRQADEEYVEEVVKKSPSIVFLPPLPEQAANVLRRHNKTTLDIFAAYVRTFVDQHVQEPDNTLPLTAVTVGGDSSSRLGDGQHRDIKARSAFVALSGYDDNFESIHDLCSTSRSGVFLEEAVVPNVGLYPEDSDLPLNAYLYDFFMHGDVNAVITANKIRRGDIWFVLNDLSMILATITTSLSNFLGLVAESDLDFIDVRGGGDDEEENREDKMLPTDAATEASAATNASNNKGPVKQDLPIQTKKKLKKKVMDSWDDEASEEDSESEASDWDADDDGNQEAPAWEEGAGLLNVLKAFKALKEDFDTKFKAMWA
ncbi:DEAD/DEAH box helicase-like protein [Cucurbitaria berberidis CBS 394.84]|uniref:DEAD/DEAH box helicase-like protein n=1 Tax=Cucurbitaria berberidis CBS 394.84 TaxID=1168544 RepID=A0A9P4LAE7_9PLEO|nr:DEAD/DEAH box helicase-like protein [Cucurbitaria berberidis CBS 394.84]KAF1847985.1 DEAD/DEAH box helicase-like protein [Cucurbitaria berberidis CBS 394.84]